MLDTSVQMQANKFFKVGPIWPFFVFSSFGSENLRNKQDLNLDRRSRR